MKHKTVILMLVIVVITMVGCDTEQSASTAGSSSASSFSVSSEISSVEGESSTFVVPPGLKTEFAIVDVNGSTAQYVPRIFETVKFLNNINVMDHQLLNENKIKPGYLDFTFETLLKASMLEPLSEEKQMTYQNKYGMNFYISKKAADKVKVDYFYSKAENVIVNFDKPIIDGNVELYTTLITGCEEAHNSMLTGIKEADGRLTADFVHAIQVVTDPNCYIYNTDTVVATLSSDGIITPDLKQLETARKVRYTFKIEDGTVKLDSIRWAQGN